jgi:NADPH-dependent curcumin reductase CurA
MVNKTLIFKKIPTGVPVPGEHLAVEDRPIDLDGPPPPGGLLVEVLYASFDPYMRGKMHDASAKSYSPAYEINGPISGACIAVVLKSDRDDIAAGETVLAIMPLAQFAAVDASTHVTKVQNPHGLDLAMFLGPLGMPGLTAYSGLYGIGKPKEGETLFVSSAAGGVGQLVGQIAKHEGLRVIGSVGSDDKLNYLVDELGFDGGFNYKKESAFDALPRLAPDGVDIYFDNVGGEQLDAALAHMNESGRIPVCGMVSGATPLESRGSGVPARGLSLSDCEFRSLVTTSRRANDTA